MGGRLNGVVGVWRAEGMASLMSNVRDGIFKTSCGGIEQLYGYGVSGTLSPSIFS